ncbi:hypothetical protein HNR46_003013 [Haloferula luteola]|uniref:DUF7133 domain-containing protein n=1 Tax=Haloferula luteola TaxID=595692 RepID=A0A840V426_9BACT|nr:hypothetical protein [Haloferula luteola]MBB5352765.1 hypothetical protein [Haloferula luteola]
MIRFFSTCLLVATAAAAQPFSFKAMPNPSGVDPQVGGVDVRPDGKVAVAFHRGELMIFDPATETWSAFAEGLQEPLGLLAESTDSLLVMQRAELTRLRDRNRDGKAETYQTVFDGFGLTGNYHEFAFGPAKAPDGSLFIALNLASNGAGIRPEIRGEWSDIGQLDFRQMQHDGKWRDRSVKAGRMYSRVPYRGWILKLSPDGKQVEPWACGFRSPDGIGFDAEGRLLVDDNQGDWRGTSPLYVVEKGGFYGHPASLVWQDDWKGGDPMKMAVGRLDRLRTKETARFPQGDLANSPTQPVVIPESWGPYARQTLIGEMNQPRLVRFLADEVDGFTQGTLIPMFDGTPLGAGNHRLAFGPDGTLWVGKTHLSWAGAEGLFRIQPENLDQVLTVTSVKLEKSGSRQQFRITFSQPVAEPGTPKIHAFDYHYHVDYGSPKTREADLPVEKAQLDSRHHDLIIETKVQEGCVHRIDLPGIVSDNGTALDATTLYYQVTRLP